MLRELQGSLLFNGNKSCVVVSKQHLIDLCDDILHECQKEEDELRAQLQKGFMWRRDGNRYRIVAQMADYVFVALNRKEQAKLGVSKDSLSIAELDALAHGSAFHIYDLLRPLEILKRRARRSLAKELYKNIVRRDLVKWNEMQESYLKELGVRRTTAHSRGENISEYGRVYAFIMEVTRHPQNEFYFNESIFKYLKKAIANRLNGQLHNCAKQFQVALNAVTEDGQRRVRDPFIARSLNQNTWAQAFDEITKSEPQIVRTEAERGQLEDNRRAAFHEKFGTSGRYDEARRMTDDFFVNMRAHASRPGRQP
ncbi:MAG TPA: hypothetical protein VFR09_05180 [Alphaproteobacteria bacterium]|nr:hypothetical protein [Alphaproteobacteria bacterium]